MPIPDFNENGVLPPYIGADWPGGSPDNISPYTVTAVDLVSKLGDSDRRREILKGWLKYRADLRKFGLLNGVQWIDGSFVEKKEPNDIDVVTFYYRPAGFEAPEAWNELAMSHIHLFDPRMTKQAFHVDAYFVSLQQPPETLIAQTYYWFGLFSHRRVDRVWKGILKIALEDSDNDSAAMHILETALTSQGTIQGGIK